MTQTNLQIVRGGPKSGLMFFSSSLGTVKCLLPLYNFPSVQCSISLAQILCVQSDTVTVTKWQSQMLLPSQNTLFSSSQTSLAVQTHVNFCESNDVLVDFIAFPRLGFFIYLIWSILYFYIFCSLMFPSFCLHFTRMQIVS